MPVTVNPPSPGPGDIWGAQVSSDITALAGAHNLLEGTVADVADDATTALAGKMPTGGTTGQALVKTGAGDYAAAWGTISATTRFLDVTKAPYSVAVNNTGDQTTALHAARDAALTAGVPLWIPKGTVRVTSTVDLARADLTVIGEGPNVSEISQATSNIPVLKLGGHRQRVEGLGVRYATQPTVGHTAAVGIELRDLFLCRYQDLRVFYSHTGIKIAQEAVSGGQNTAFSSVFDGIEVNGWRATALDLRSYVGNSTPVEMRNIYLHNNPGGSVETSTAHAVWIEKYDGIHFATLNIEWCDLTAQVPFLVNGASASIDRLHLEGVTIREFGSGLVSAYGDASLDIRGLEIQTVVFAATASGPHGIITTGGAPSNTRPVRVHVRDVKWLSGTATPTNPVSVHRSIDSTAAEVVVEQLDGSVPAAVTVASNGGTLTRVDVARAGQHVEAVTYGATITPVVTGRDSTKAITLTGNTTINAPTGAWTGARMTFVFTQDGTGGRTVTWNAAFKVNWTPTTTANKINTVSFEYNGTAWVQVASAVNL